MPNAIDRWPSIDVINPFRSLSRAQDSLDRMFNEIMPTMTPTRFLSANEGLVFAPSCEVTDEGASYSVKVDLPGVSKDNVKVEAFKDQLTIHAERREEKKSETKRKYLSEVSYGSYDRSFTLPGLIDDKKIDAKFENGVLTVSVPKAEASGGRQIPIH